MSRRSVGAEIIIGRHPVAEAIDAGVSITKIVFSDGARPAPILDSIRRAASAAAIPLETEPRGKLDEMARGANHQGVIALTEAFSYESKEALVIPGPCRLILLDGVTDPSNVGSIARSADAFGWTGLLIPSHRSGGVTAAVRKVAAGAAERVPIARVGSAAETVAWLERNAVWVMGLDPTGRDDYSQIEYPERVCLVMGAEGKGLSRLVKDRCDLTLRIAMQGSLSSINVAVAAAVVMAEEARRRGLK